MHFNHETSFDEGNLYDQYITIYDHLACRSQVIFLIMHVKEVLQFDASFNHSWMIKPVKTLENPESGKH